MAEHGPERPPEDLPPDAGELAAQLQEAFLPDQVPVFPRVDVSASYLLADPEDGAGGDWFDAAVTPDGGLALVVGDAVGRGVDAVATAAQLRAVLLQQLRAGADIEPALAAVDALARDLPDGVATTVCLALLDQETGRLRYATAGHPPPLVVDPDGTARYLPPSGGPALGLPGPVQVEETALQSGDLLLLYTDGAVERPSRTSAQNSLDLAALAGEAFGTIGGGHGLRSTVDAVCDRLLERLVARTGFADDMVLLAAERMPEPYLLDLALPAETPTVRAVRAALWEWLDDLRARDLDVVALLHAVGELVSNAVEHAYADDPDPGPDAVSVSARLEGAGDVVVTVADRGRWRPGRVDESRGRGLALAGGLVDDLCLERGPDGTLATLRHGIGRPVRMFRSESGARPGPPGGEAFDTTESGPGRVAVHGPVDQLSADVLRESLLLRAHGGTASLVVDLSEVTFLGSAGVQVLAEILRWQRGDVHLRLVAATGSAAQHVLETVGLPYGRP